MDQYPPKWMVNTLEAICPAHMRDEIEGDFFEYYAGMAKKHRQVFVNRKAFGFLLASAPRLILKRRYHTPNYIDMLKNYIVIAFRNLKRQLGYTSVNIFGLAIGLASCILIGIYVLHELSYDTFHEKADRIFRVSKMYKNAGRSEKIYHTSTALLPHLRRDFNDVSTGVRVYNVSMFSPVIVQKGDTKYQEPSFLYVDSTFFDVFSFKVKGGDPAKALVEPRSVVFTESSAVKYFGDKDPLGELVQVDGIDYTVTAVLEDVPGNSHLKFDFLGSFTSLKASQQEVWHSANYATYIVLADPSAKASLGQAISDMVAEKLADYLKDTQVIFDLMPLTDIHLRSDVTVEMQPQNDIRYIYVISFVGLLVLVIACINYMNLATARSLERAREVGMRKVLGAIRKQVFYQFMGESVIVTLVSMVVALVLVNLFLGTFNQLTAKALGWSEVFNLQMIVGFVIVFITVSFLAGAYPALNLSSFAPSDVLKGSFKRTKSGSWVRKALVIVQFSISIFLIIGTLIIYQQLSFMQNKKLGYEKENVLVLPTDGEVNINFMTLKTELERRQDVISVSIASESPTDVGGTYSLSIPGQSEDLSVQAVTADADFLNTMQMEVISGRNFTPSDHTLATKEIVEDRWHAFIVNQALLKTLMINEASIIGEKVNLNGRKGEIVGVVEDFHFTSLHRKITPLVLFIEPRQFHQMFIRISPDNLQGTLTAIEDQWKEIVPNRPFVFNFLDDEYDALYRNEMRLGNVFTTFAILAILIACLGLFGLVSFAVQQRTKEIGIRKVMGASVKSLFFLVSKDFSKLVLLAFVIAAPLGYWLMGQWLNDFEYRVSIGFWPMLIAVVCTTLVAFLTVSYQSIRAATLNPADTLRNE